MLRLATATAIGLIFGSGIVIAGMSNPAKVINFFDLFGTFDLSLALVMASALLVTALGYRFVLRRPSPILAPNFSLPTSRVIDRPLVAGSALFGIGWGIAGFCPGGAIPALGLGEPAAWLFVLAMIVAIVGTSLFRAAHNARAALASTR